MSADCSIRAVRRLWINKMIFTCRPRGSLGPDDLHREREPHCFNILLLRSDDWHRYANEWGNQVDLHPICISLISMDFNVQIHQSIALETLDISSFGSVMIGQSVRSQIDVNALRERAAFREFAAERFVLSSRTQKTFDRSSRALSNDGRINEIRWNGRPQSSINAFQSICKWAN